MSNVEAPDMRDVTTYAPVRVFLFRPMAVRLRRDHRDVPLRANLCDGKNIWTAAIGC